MRWFGFCVSGASRQAVVRSPVSSPAITSPLKKSLIAAERKRDDVARARRRWVREQGLLDPAHLIFIDETAVSTNMVRPNGWSPRGERLVGHVPMAHWKNNDVHCWLPSNRNRCAHGYQGSHERRGLPCLYRTMSGSRAQTPGCGGDRQRPFPQSPRRTGGNRGSRRNTALPAAVFSRFQSMVFHPLKTFLRKAAERTIEGLQRCVRSYIRALDPSECMGYFTHAGYEPS